MIGYSWKFALKYKLSILGVIIGALGGYLYYHYVGCFSGARVPLRRTQ
jgi:hypothetical protein